MNAVALSSRRRRRVRRPFTRAESPGARASPPHAPHGGRATDTISRNESPDVTEVTGVAQTPILCYAGGA